MNIVNKALLSAFLLPKALYRKLGVNTNQLQAILHTKLTMDDRRPSSLLQTQQNRKKPLRMATVGTMFISAFLGLIYLTCFMYSDDMTTSLTIYYSMFFVMLAASLIADFTSVLIDVRDTFIILPKPVSDRTFVVSRLLHITIHICKIVLPMSLPGMVYMAFTEGIFGMLVFVFMILMLTLFVIFFINAVYLLILKITTPQKFRNIISYIQIIFAIAIYASYQLMPRLMSNMELFQTRLSEKPYVLLYPLYWFASGWTVLTQWQGHTLEWAGACLALIIPVTGVWIVIRFLAPSFNNKLAMIQGSGTSSEETVRPVNVAQQQRGYAQQLSRWFTNTTSERAGFLFTWKLMTRSRDFKIKVYPAIGYLIVYIIIIFFNSRSRSLSELMEDAAAAKAMVVLGLYFGSFVLTVGLAQMVFSEKYKASWLYHVMPIAQPGHILSGGVKAAILLFYFPMVVFITATGLLMLGPGVLPNIIFGLCNQLLISYLTVYVQPRKFPFSTLQQTDQKSGSFMRGLLTLFISLAIGFTHYMLYDFTIVIFILCPLSAIATWMIASSIRNTTWAKVRSSYTDE